MINKDMRISSAVKENPSIVDLLGKYGIDFCCGSHKNLGEEIKNKGLDVDKVVDELNEYKKVDVQKNWKKALNMSEEELIPYLIENHHIYEEDLIEKTDKLLSKILKVHYLKHGSVLGELYTTFTALKGELAIHFAKEEKEVFPQILDKNNTKEKELMDEHEKAGELLHKIEKLTDNFNAPSDSCTTYKTAFMTLKELVDDIHIHIFLENNVLFKENN